MENPSARIATPIGCLDYALAGCGARRDAVTADALERVGLLLDSGRTQDALGMLDYARRLAPADAGIDLAIALVRLDLGDASAMAPLEALTARTDRRDIWMALVRVRMRFGDVEGAQQDLCHVLGRNSPPTNPLDIALANTVAEQCGGRGWCGLNNAGRVLLGPAHTLIGKLVVMLDGRAVAQLRLAKAKGLREVRLPDGWEHAARLDVLLRGRPLLGSPIDIARITRVSGFVEAQPASGLLRGWCWFPAEPECPPTIEIASPADPAGAISVRAQGIDPAACPAEEFGQPYAFAIEADKLGPLGDVVDVTGPHGHVLYGSPVRLPNARAQMAAVRRRFPLGQARGSGRARPIWGEFSVPVAAGPPRRAPVSARTASRRPVDIVIPVHAGVGATAACISAVRKHLAADERIIVVADAPPDPAMIAMLAPLADDPRIVLHIETVNRGFPAAANIGFRRAAGHDVVLLNADTVVTPGWLAGLRAAVHSAHDIGTATPLSNNATIFSYPHGNRADRDFDMSTVDDLAALAAEVNRDEVTDVPTAHGFCCFIRTECLRETGLFREDLFAQGYGEENDFCLRAAHFGWRHVAAPGVFVGHHGAASFGAGRDDLMRRNLQTLNRLHVGYDHLIARWQDRDPLGASRRRLDMARLTAACAGRDAVLLITHDRAGGVGKYVARRAAVIAQSGRQALLLRPDNTLDGLGKVVAHAVLLGTENRDEYPNLRFRLPDEDAALIAFLKLLGVGEVELNSLVGHADSVVDLAAGWKASLDVIVHDYSWFCPRITLTTGDHRYCGEPEIAECHRCIDANGGSFDEAASPTHLVARSRRLFDAARSIIAPSEDAARRIGRRFGAEIRVRAWDAPRTADPRPVDRSAGRLRPVRVCVVGAIGYEKGYNVLLACARAAATRELALEFVVVGYTRDDRRLLDTGTVRITGRYEDDEAVALIAAQKADYGWLPTVCPETWSYALTQMWDAGLFVVVHDIGAPAERVRALAGGLIAPLHMPPDRLATLFVDPTLFRSRHVAARPASRAAHPSDGHHFADVSH